MIEYDPKTCITAGELREFGAQIPQDILDCGWIPRNHLSLKLGTHELSGLEPTQLQFSIELTFLSEFRWVKATFEISDGR